MSAAFGFGVAVTIRVTVLLIVVAVVAATLRRRSAALQHALWTSAIIASLTVPVLTLTLPRVGVPAVLPASNMWSWMTNAGSGKREAGRGMSQRNGNAPAMGRGLAAATIANILNGGPGRRSSAATIETIVLGLWLAGLLILLARPVASTAAVAGLRRRARVVTDERILSVFGEIRDSGTSNVILMESDEVTAPATTGIVRPIILLSRDAHEWNATRLRATLTHEYAHVVRRDCLTQLLADIARAIYWFNPLVWYARRRMIIERERACDDLVIGHGVRPDRYASVLVDTVRTSLAHRGTIAFGVLSMARSSELETRLVSILDPMCRRRPMSRKATASMAMAIAIGTILVAGSRVEAAQTIVPLEPDLRGDSIAKPLSEKIPLSETVISAARNSPALYGPDSILARRFYAQLDREPTWEGDLVRDRSAWALSIARNGELIAPLLDALKDRDWRVRAYAAWSLAESRDRRAVPLLLPLLRDANWRMRAMATQALNDIGDRAAEQGMYAVLKDEAWQVRAPAVAYFGELRDPKYKGVLEAALNDHHIMVRIAAADALRDLTNN